MNTPCERDPRFDEWWALYPRKVAKKSAEKAWSKLAPDARLVEQIMAGLKAQLHSKAMQPNAMGDKSYIPHAATWINGRRWEDSCASIASSPRCPCPRCADTGVVIVGLRIPDREEAILGSCSCPAGQLPGVLAGVGDTL